MALPPVDISVNTLPEEWMHKDALDVVAASSNILQRKGYKEKKLKSQASFGGCLVVHF